MATGGAEEQRDECGDEFGIARKVDVPVITENTNRY